VLRTFTSHLTGLLRTRPAGYRANALEHLGASAGMRRALPPNMTKHNSPRLHTVFVVRESAAKMPNSCWGRYTHVGVIRCWGRYTDQLRVTKSQDVPWYSARNFDGLTERSASHIEYRRAVAAAERMREQYAASLAAGYVEHLSTRAGLDEI
jgi:hypothetical protein